MSEQWLPEGRHWGLVIERRPAPDVGALDGQAGHKTLWHTTEGFGIDAMHRVLVAKGAEVQFLIDPSAGDSRVIQMLGIGRVGKGLEHPPGTAETNAAGCVQIEIVDKAINAPNWNDYFYRDLAALAVLIEHRFAVPRSAPHAFSIPAKRFTPPAFIAAQGHVGHCHAASQPAGHWDPGRLDPHKLFAAMADVDRRYA